MNFYFFIYKKKFPGEKAKKKEKKHLKRKRNSKKGEVERSVGVVIGVSQVTFPGSVKKFSKRKKFCLTS